MNTQELPLLPGVNGYDKYAIRCNPETKRIESATYEIFGDSNDFITTILPENKISDYLLINNEYIYDPIPTPELINPIEVLQSEIAELKSQNEMLTECLLEVSEEIYN